MVNTKVKCETDPDIKKRFSQVEKPVGFLDKQVDSSTTTLAAIICTAVVIVVVVIAITLVVLKKKNQKEKREEQQELNDLYGTYYRGVEYNIATVNNPRYNEDGGTGDAVVTDENVYHQL